MSIASQRIEDQSTTNVSSNSMLVQVDLSLPEKMELHCPFTWKPQTKNLPETLIKKQENSLKRIGDQQGERTQWIKFILNLVLSYEHFKLVQIDEASHKQSECERIIHDLESIGKFKFISKTAFQHVCLSNKVFLLSKIEKKEYSEIVRDVKHFENMDNKERATVWSIRACVLMVYDSEIGECISFMEKALELHPDCAEWHYLLGRFLGRERRDKTEVIIPEDREIEALQLAVNKSNDPHYKVFLARAYSEKARVTCRLKSSNGITSQLADFESEIKKMNEISSRLFRDSLKNGDDDVYVLFNCTRAFNTFPGELQDVNLAKKCVFRALELSPGVDFLCHAAGCMVKKENPDRAKQYFMQAIENGYFSSCFHLLRMKHEDNKSYDPRADMERYFQLFTNNFERVRLFAWLGAFHFFVKYDFNSALDSWLQIFKENHQSNVLNEVCVPWSIEPWKVDIGKTIISEINKKIGNSSDAEECKKYIEILKDIENYRPDIYQKYTVKTSQQNQMSCETPMSRNASSRSNVENKWRRKTPS